MNAICQDSSAQRHSRPGGGFTTASVRGQAAFVRALLDELERISPAGKEGAFSAQLVEELARLGCRCLEAATALSAVVPDEARLLANAGVTSCA